MVIECGQVLRFFERTQKKRDTRVGGLMRKKNTGCELCSSLDGQNGVTDRQLK